MEGIAAQSIHPSPHWLNLHLSQKNKTSLQGSIHVLDKKKAALLGKMVGFKDPRPDECKHMRWQSNQSSF
jgi:hypothetical protein